MVLKGITIPESDSPEENPVISLVKVIVNKKSDSTD